MNKDMIKQRARALDMRDKVMRTLEDLVDGDELALTGSGFATTLGDVYASILCAVFAKNLGAMKGEALGAAIRRGVETAIADGSLAGIERGWAYMLGAEDGMTNDHLTILFNHHTRFSQGSNEISMHMGTHWSVAPSCHTPDPSVAVLNEDIPAALIRSRQEEIAVAHGLDAGEAARVRICIAEGEGYRSLDASDAPLPRLEDTYRECFYVIEGLSRTIHDDVASRPHRMQVGFLRAAVMLHAPEGRFLDILPRHIGTTAFTREEMREITDTILEEVATHGADMPIAADPEVETWIKGQQLEMRMAYDGVDADTLHRVRLHHQSMIYDRTSGGYIGHVFAETRKQTAKVLKTLTDPPALGDPVPLASYVVDVPLQRALVADGLDLHEAVTDIVTAEVTWRRDQQASYAMRAEGAMGNATAKRPALPGTALIERYGIEFVNGRIKARFEIAPNVLWDGGTLLARRTSFPDVILGALAEQPVERMVDHPLLAGLMIKRVKVGLKGARADIVKPARPLPERQG